MVQWLVWQPEMKADYSTPHKHSRNVTGLIDSIFAYHAQEARIMSGIKQLFLVFCLV